MKRVVTAAVASGLLLVPAAASVSAARPTSAGNKGAAERDAARLLQRVELPPRAVRISREPRGDGGLLREASSIPSGLLVDRHLLWVVHEPLAQVVAFVGRHQPRGGRKSGTGSAGGKGIPPNASITFSLPALAGRISLRELELALVALPHGSTGVRADAQDIWVVPRPVGEKVPSPVRVVDVRSSHAHVHVTAADKVRRIVRWFDALPIVQPGGAYHCPPTTRPSAAMTLRFLTAGGSLLAHAHVPAAAVNGLCAPIEFWIGSHRQMPLGGLHFYARIERLLGVRLG